MQAVFRTVVRLLLRPSFNPRVSIAWQRRIAIIATRMRFLPRDVRCEMTTLGGVPTQLLTAVDASGDRAVIYLHGGAYILGSPETHRNLAAHLAQAAQCVVYTPDYRLAPEHPYPAALDDALAVYRALLAQGLSGGQIAISGDSAGGGLSLALAQRIRAEKLPAPASLYLLSPWTDLTLSGETAKTCADIDPLITRAWGAAGAAHYAGNKPLTDPLVSPLFADYRGMPSMLIQCGSDEVLRSDSERVAERAMAANVDVQLKVFQGLWHVFQMFAGMMPASSAAVREAGDYLQSRWPRQSAPLV